MNAADKKRADDIIQHFFQFSVSNLPDAMRAFTKTLVGRGGNGRKRPDVVLSCAEKKQLCLINWNLCFSSVLNRLLKYGGDFGERTLLLFKQSVQKSFVRHFSVSYVKCGCNSKSKPRCELSKKCKQSSSTIWGPYRKRNRRSLKVGTWEESRIIISVCDGLQVIPS